MLCKGHAGFGRRLGETHQRKRWQGAPGRPHLHSELDYVPPAEYEALHAMTRPVTAPLKTS